MFRGCRESPQPFSAPAIPMATAMAFRVFGARQHPGVARWRGSLLYLHLPLSTLRTYRYR